MIQRLLLASVFSAAAALAQVATPISVLNTSNVGVKPGDAVNDAIRVNIVAGGGSSAATFGAAFPATGTAVGFLDGSGNLRTARIAGDNLSLQAMLAGATSAALVDGVSNTGIVLGQAQDGASVLPVVTRPYAFVGSGWDRDFICTNSVAVSVASGTTEIIAASGSTKVYLCDITLVAASPVDISVKRGTGTNCGTGTTTLIDALVGVTAVDLKYGGAVRTPASGAVCITLGTAVATKGVVTYAQF